MKKCMKCGNPINKDIYDYCHICWLKLKEEEETNTPQDSFQEGLKGLIYTTYIMFYEDKVELVFICNGCGSCVQTDKVNGDNKLRLIKKTGNYFG